MRNLLSVLSKTVIAFRLNTTNSHPAIFVAGFDVKNIYFVTENW